MEPPVLVPQFNFPATTTTRPSTLSVEVALCLHLTESKQRQRWLAVRDTSSAAMQGPRCTSPSTQGGWEGRCRRANVRVRKGDRPACIFGHCVRRKSRSRRHKRRGGGGGGERRNRLGEGAGELASLLAIPTALTTAMGRTNQWVAVFQEAPRQTGHRPSPPPPPPLPTPSHLAQWTLRHRK